MKNEVATNDTFSLEKIPDYLEGVKKELEITSKAINTPTPKISKDLKISEERHEGLYGRTVLVRKLSEIIMKEHYWKKAVKEVGMIEGSEFKFKEHCLSDIRKAFKSEFSISLMIDKHQKLNEIKTELEKYLTDDHKAKAAFENLASIMSEG